MPSDSDPQHILSVTPLTGGRGGLPALPFLISPPLSVADIVSPLKGGRGGPGLLVLHCTDTRPSQDFTIEKLTACHKARGFGDLPGYHFYVRRDGSLYYCRPLSMRGCHVKGHNANSIGICYEGGHSDSPEYKYEDNRTAEQLVVLDELLRTLLACFPRARLIGHNELAPKACPCFDVQKEYAYLMDPSPALLPQGHLLRGTREGG